MARQLFSFAVLFLALWASSSEAGRVRSHFPAEARCQPGDSNCARAFVGCNAYEGQCRCERAFCCSNPFKYKDLRSCLHDNKPVDPCSTNPCKNRGYCLEMGDNSYRCMCHHTGYYGRKCEERCPTGDEVMGVFKKIWETNDRKKMRQLLPCLTF